MRLVRNAFAVARMEATLFSRFPKLRLSVVGIALIPAIYACIYLGSVLDPASQTAHLPAAIVNLDKGAQVGEQRVDLGADLVVALKAKKAFGYYDSTDEKAVRQDVRNGKSLFALIIPEDFSASAMSARAPGAGRLVVYASEGNNYTGAGFAKRFSSELGHQLNETLNEKRWATVLGVSASSADSLQRLREGVATLQQGATRLNEGLLAAKQASAKLAGGSTALSTGVSTLTEGVKQLHAGASTLASRSPAPEDLRRLSAGAAQLANGHVELRRGLAELERGNQRLIEGAEKMRDDTKDILLVGDRIAAGANELANGGKQLQAGLQAAGQAQGRLGDGAASLAKGVDQLTEGFGTYAANVNLLANKFPPDARLNELSAGAKTLGEGNTKLSAGVAELQSGSSLLASGLQTLAAALPASSPGLQGTPAGLANTVTPDIQIDAPVQNNGMGLAPNFIPVALWMGAVMTAFIFHLRLLPAGAEGHSRPALLLGKLTILGSINIVQALCVFGLTWLLLGLTPVHAAGLVLTMIVSSLTFMLVILVFVRAFGDAGKAMALILLVLQLSAAGGVMPVELTNDFFRAISPWLPFTWSIQAVRASAFDAFGGAWGQALAVLGAFTVVAFTLSLVIGKWRFVGPDEHRPAMDI